MFIEFGSWTQLNSILIQWMAIDYVRWINSLRCCSFQVETWRPPHVGLVWRPLWAALCSKMGSFREANFYLTFNPSAPMDIKAVFDSVPFRIGLAHTLTVIIESSTKTLASIDWKSWNCLDLHYWSCGEQGKSKHFVQLPMSHWQAYELLTPNNLGKFF